MFANNNIFKDPFVYDLIVHLESGQLAVADLQAEHIIYEHGKFAVRR